jgi:hypothetical protein
MWTYNQENNKWVSTKDRLKRNDFDLYNQEIEKVRFYSKCLSGATYASIMDTNNIYPILNLESKDWSINLPFSANTNNIQKNIVNQNTYQDFVYSNLEYNYTLKNYFSPLKSIQEFKENYEYIDVATNEEVNLDLISENYIIDGIRLKPGHNVLVKDQYKNVTLNIDDDPNTIFNTQWEVINNNNNLIEYRIPDTTNGIYTYQDLQLKRKEIIDYKSIINKSYVIKLGSQTGKQYYIQRLNNGYYPLLNNEENVLFKEGKNWLLRHQVDYNNLWDINYYDVLYDVYNSTERTIFIGEFGSILVNQEGYSNFIENKYKIDLKSISSVDSYYYIVGEKGILLKIDKKYLTIEKINLDCLCVNNRITSNLNNISFFNNNLGLIVGDFNTIFITEDGGNKWNKIHIKEFESFNYNKSIWISNSLFYIIGKSGVYLEFNKTTNNNWIPTLKKISKFIDLDEEFVLIDDIYDIKKINIQNLTLSYSYNNSVIELLDDEFLLLTTSSGLVILHDLYNKILDHNFLYLEFEYNYGDIITIDNKDDKFYFTGTNISTLDSGIFSFNITNFNKIGEDNNFSNIVKYDSIVVYESELYANKIKIDNNSIFISGNNGIAKKSEDSNILSFSELDLTLGERLKSKMLFLNYDIATKLNFFTDSGIYRLPNSVNIDINSINQLSIEFKSKSNELSWLDYFKDSNLTFEYYVNNPLSELSKVKFNTVFKHSNIITEHIINKSEINIDPNIVKLLAPTITDDTFSRYKQIQGINILQPNDNSKLYLNSYIMIYKVANNYPVQKGDILYLESNVINTNLIVNKIVNLSGSKYLYCFTEFNQNIITDIKKTDFIKITNLNYFSTLEEIQQRINNHYIGIAYNINILDNNIQIDSIFNNYTAYYNLAIDISINNNISSMEYDESFLKFGFTPTYNILDYLSNIDSDYFNPDKLYLSMPDYRSIPNIIIGIDNIGNKILISSDFKYIWDSLFINTFIDINLNTQISINTKRLLIIEKYYDESINKYVIELNKKIKSHNLNFQTIDLISRRKLKEISEDLSELNTIQTIERTIELNDSEFNTFDLTSKTRFNTDSYAKILLSDKKTKETISSIIYSDYQGNLSLNITNLPKTIDYNIIDTGNINGNLLIITDKPHNILSGQQVRIKFIGGENSSEVKNPQYSGYHNVERINEYQLKVNIEFGELIEIQDIGIISFIKNDQFLNYQPIDLIEVGVNKKNKIAIELNVENTISINNIFILTNVNFSKFRFRLIDGLDIETLSENFQWILEAEISNAVIGQDNNKKLIWYSGIWECGRWFGGTWVSGTWLSGDWYDGLWMSKTIKDNYINIEFDEKSSNSNSSYWFNGRWFNGIWNNGTWFNGRWYDGKWDNGRWFNGMWNNGMWNNGEFSGGVWIEGIWKNGKFNSFSNRSYWLNGQWEGGDFENGMWFNGTFTEKNNESRFGTRSDNSRASTWQSGEWFNGSFHSRINTMNNDYDVSETHRYSIWKTGNWYDGSFYGGVAFNINFKSGTWYGGVLEDISIIGINSEDNYLILDGIYYLNIGYEFNIIGNPIVEFESIGTYDNPVKYKVLKSEIIEDENITIVIVDKILTQNTNIEYTGLKMVSSFIGSNWKSGIWTNGIFDGGLFEGGIWYNGIFKGIWT